MKSKTKGAFNSNLKAELAAGKPRDQALAIAFRVQREAKKATGGAIMPTMKMSGQHAGFVQSNVAGRTDKLPMRLRAGSYVIPAATVSSLGEGNSLAGANALDKLFSLGPYGAPKTQTPYGARESGSTRSMKRPMRFADGGDVPPVDVIVAGGEYIVPPQTVAELGNGDLTHGHSVLDEFVKHIKSKTIKTLKNLPGPKNS